MPRTRATLNQRQSTLAFEPVPAEDVALPRRSSRRSGGPSTQSTLTSYLEKKSSSSPAPLTSSQAGKTTLSRDYSFGESETSDDGGVFSTPARPRASRKRKRDDFVVADDEVEDSEESDDDVVVRGKVSRLCLLRPQFS
jgi:hypothetical protein